MAEGVQQLDVLRPIRRFRVVYKGIKPPRPGRYAMTYGHYGHHIDQLNYIEQLVHRGGIHQIRHIVFYFDCKNLTLPYSIHPIMLYQKNGRLIISCYSYYNAKNEKIILHPHDQQVDCQSLISFLIDRNSILLDFL